MRSAGQGIPGRQKLLSITKDFIEENLYGVSQSWQALARIFARPWFSRAWIIQEAVFASKTWPWFYWGRESKNWVLISGVAEAFNLASRFQILPVDSSVCGFKTISSIEGLRRNVGRENLLFLLMRTRNQAATDPRDKINCVLGMLPYNEDGYRPRYDVDASELYTIVATWALQSPNIRDPLLLLSNAYHNSASLSDPPSISMPSLVPNWSQTSVLELLWHGNYSARGNSKPSF